MIYCIERHHLIGEHDREFEELYARTYLPRLDEEDEARLLWYAQTPHGAGEAYYIVTVTGFADVAAWERWGERLRRGDLADWLEEADSRRYRCVGSLVSELPWSPLQLTELPPASPGTSKPGLLRLDVLGFERYEQLIAMSAWETDRKLAVMELVGAFVPILAPFDEIQAFLLYRIGAHDEVVRAFDADGGRAPWLGGYPLPGGVVHLESRLLRTASWSPLS
jgi:hypothetical protein